MIADDKAAELAAVPRLQHGRGGRAIPADKFGAATQRIAGVWRCAAACDAAISPQTAAVRKMHRRQSLPRTLLGEQFESRVLRRQARAAASVQKAPASMWLFWRRTHVAMRNLPQLWSTPICSNCRWSPRIIKLAAINLGYRGHKNIGFPHPRRAPYPDMWAKGDRPTPHALPNQMWVVVPTFLPRNAPLAPHSQAGGCGEDIPQYP